MVDPIGGLGQWGDFTDEELKRDGTYSGLLLLPGGAYYDPVAGRYVQRVGDADNEYRSGDRGTVLFQMIGAVDVLHSGNGLDFIAGLGDGLAYSPLLGETSTGFARRHLGQLLGIGDANEVVDQKTHQYFWGGIASDVLTLLVPGGEAGALKGAGTAAEAAEIAETAGARAAQYGEFSIIDWSGYPEGAPRPTGPFRILEGEEYAAARRTADAENKLLREMFPELKPYQIHEWQPIKFGGSPTNPANKIPLPRDPYHNEFSRYWDRVLRSIKR